MFNTPILFLIFSRPETTKQVLDRIRAIKPFKLYVAADGPRMDREGEVELCNQTRHIVLDGIDWDCEVRTLFRNENLGCGVAPSEAITWFFQNEEAGIILEDDCLPSFSFFSFAEYCLHKYRDIPQVMHIGGNNYFDHKWGEATYFYSAYNHIWGWATWRRAWELYNFDLQSFDKKKLYHALNSYFPKSISKGWLKFYDSSLNHIVNNPSQKCDFWDYQWSFSIWLNRGICVYPNVNLVSNIGFGPDATHTLNTSDKFSNLPYQELKDITSPCKLKRNKKADIISSNVVFGFKAKRPLTTLIKNINALSTSLSGTIIKTTKKLIPHPVKSLIKTTFAVKKASQHEPETLELERVKSKPKKEPGTTTLLNENFSFLDGASFVFMYEEIFKKNIYAFTCPDKKPYIIDCSANIGLSILYFKSLFPDARIIAFEPDPKIYQLLQANVDGLTDVVLREKVLCNEETSKKVFSEGVDGGSVNEVSSTVEKDKILTERLSTYITGKVDFLKIVVKGADLNVILECEDKLHLVQNIFIEYHSFVESKQELATLLAILEQKGFRYHINGLELSSGQPFKYQSDYKEMDMQLNIYAFKR